MAQFCTKCGSEIKPGSKFCMVCGKKIEDDLVGNRVAQNVPNSAEQNKLTGKSNNKMIVALIVALVVIGGICGYFFLGRSTGNINTAAEPQSNPTQQATKPTENVPKNPTSVVKQDNARNAFISFHTAITNRQMGDAFNILSPSYQRFMKSYDNFVRGYTTTLRSDVVELNTIHEDSSSATLTYKLKAVDREGSGEKTQYFIGKANLIKINGQWRIDSAEAKVAPQNNTSAGNAPNANNNLASELSLGGIVPANNPNYIKGVFGEPTKIVRNPNISSRTYTYHYGNGFTIQFFDDFASIITSTSNNGIGTRSGIHVGSTVEDVKRVLGTPAKLPPHLKSKTDLMRYIDEPYSKELILTIKDGKVVKMELSAAEAY